MQGFHEEDIISTFDDLNKNHAPPEFIFSKNQGCVVYYNLCFDEDTQFSNIIMSIRIDKELYVQIQRNGCMVLLPP